MLNNKKFPHVSVIVPAYNEEKYIDECLRSIKRQNYSKVELIVIDDGSTDETKNIAKKYADVLLLQLHKGPAIARNKAAKIAKGEMFVFIDADMYLDKNYIQNIIKPILKGNAFATFTKEEYVANPENIWSKCFQIDNDLPANLRIRTSQGYRSNRFRAITRKEFFKTKGYLEHTGYGEDEVLRDNLALVAPGAICYHYNPDTLKEVFLSARWVGRSRQISKNITNLVKYSVPYSLKISFMKINQGTPLSFFIYKLIFDLGVFSGILQKKKGLK